MFGKEEHYTVLWLILVHKTNAYKLSGSQLEELKLLSNKDHQK